MKDRLRFTILGGATLLFALALTGCGSGGHERFVFLRDTASGASVAHSSRAASAGQRGSAVLAPHAHTTRLRASVAADIGVGTIDVYQGTAGSTSIKKLNSVSGAYDNVRLSPDGKTVGFTALDSAGYSQVFVAPLSSFDTPTQLTTGTTFDYFGVNFTPDSNYVVVSEYDTTTAAQPTTFAVVKISDGSITAVTPPGFTGAWYPSVTPDGNSLVFEGLATTATNAAIYVSAIDGSSPVQITNLSDTVWDWAPSLTKDGKTVAFIREDLVGTNGDNVYVVPITGESGSVSATQLTTDGYDDFLEALDKQIVFESYKDNTATTSNDSIYSIRTSGSSLHRLTNTTMQDGFIDFNVLGI